MEKYREFLVKRAHDRVADAQTRLDKASEGTAVVAINRTVADVKLQGELAHLPNRLASIDEFFRNVTPATTMPARGEMFVDFDGNSCSSHYERWHSFGSLCIVIDPNAGYIMRLTASEDGMVRTGDPGTPPGLEFAAGDLLEFLGVGPAPDLKPGDPVVLTRQLFQSNYVCLRHPMESYEEPYQDDPHGIYDKRIIYSGLQGRVTQASSAAVTFSEEWPDVPGHVVSTEPRCSAYTLLENGTRTIEEAENKTVLSIGCFGLHQVFLPRWPELKAATKKK